MAQYRKHIRGLGKNLSALKSKVDDLGHVYSDVNRLVEIAEREGWVRSSDVDGWLQKVEILNRESEEILADGEKIMERKYMGGLYFWNWRPRYEQSRLAEDKKAEVEHELTRGRTFIVKEDVAHEPADRILARSIEALRDKMGELQDVFETVKQLVRREEEQHSVRTLEVDGWLKRVEELLGKEALVVLEEGELELVKSRQSIVQGDSEYQRNSAFYYDISKRFDEKRAILEQKLIEGRNFVVFIGLDYAKLMNEYARIDRMHVKVGGDSEAQERPASEFSFLSSAPPAASDVSLPTDDVYTPSAAPATECEVVLSGNGCGEILDRLYKDMEDAGIKVFADDKQAHEFGEMGTEPPRLPNIFKIYVPIFSRNYASSERCLFELVDMVKPRNVSARPGIVPIFYDVEPADVMLRTELYKKAIGKHKCSYETVQLWEEALTEVARVKGWALKHKDDIKLCRLIAGGILNKLKVKQVSPYPFGVEDQVNKIKNLLDIESGGVSLVAIHGIGGIGKTTLAKEVFDQIKMHFSGSSFLADIRESSKHKDLRYLQDQLCKDILGKNFAAGRIRERFRAKRVLIVLDDVDEREQMKQLAGKSSWYGSGSRILVTTREMNVLSVKQEEFDKVRVIRVPIFDQGKSLQLFCMHAFGSYTPPNEYHDLSKQIVDHTGGVPLVLEILGSSLNRKSQQVWEGTLEKLQKMPYHEIHDILMISYETLDDAAGQIFLDIALFFVGMEKATPVYMWEACDFFPEMQLEILVFMCLLKVTDGDKFWMHDLVRDLAYEICHRNEGRLWMHEEVLDMLKIEEGEIEACAICYDDSLWGGISSNGSKSKKSLRYLELRGGSFTGEPECSLSNLKWLSWHSCQVEIEVANLCLEDLVILDLSKSSISHKWVGWRLIEMATNLKVLNLTSCKNLIRTPDLSNYMSLEKLILEGCEALVEIDTSIEKVQRLKYLNIRGCFSLTSLPKEVCFLICLEEIAMDGNGQSFKLPIELGHLTSLSTLELANVEILEIPWQIGKLENIESLSLSACFGLEKLPDTLGDLKSLELLDISEMKVKKLPPSIGRLKKLRVLKMDSSSISELPVSIGGLENLEEFHAGHCKDLHGAVPKEIGRLNCLHFLDLSFTNISSLPSTINQLCLLQTLHLESCNELEELPELPKSLVSLRVKSQKLQKFPSLSGFGSLVHLQLFHNAEKQGNRLSEFNVDGIIQLPRLETLESCIPNIITPPVESHSMSNLSRLFLSHLELDNVLPHLYNLKRLSFLDVVSCSVKDNGPISLGEFKALEHLSAHNCNFGNIYPLLAKTLRMLSIKACKLCDGLLDLSELRNLIVMELSSCDQVSEVRGLGELEFLRDVVIKNCSLLQTLGDLSKLQRLELLKVESCHSLTRVDGLNKIKSLKFLQIYDCKSLEISEDKSESTKRKHKYST